MRDEPAATFVEVAVPLPVGQTLTYQLPQSSPRTLSPGVRVRVPVGSRALTGFLVQVGSRPPEGVTPRPVERFVDRQPPLPEDLLELARFASAYYLHPLGDLLAAMLPADLPGWGELQIRITDRGALAPPRNPSEAALRDLLLARGPLSLSEAEEALGGLELGSTVERWLGDGRIDTEVPEGRSSRYVTAYEVATGNLQDLLAQCGRSPAGRAVVELLSAAGRPMLASEIGEAAGCGLAVLRRLASLGVLHRFSQPARLRLDRHLLPLSTQAPGALPLVLRPDQRAALDGVRESLDRRAFASFLLHGVTGAGKTEVYLSAAELALARGRGVLLLVPEIALVPALAAQAASRFGDRLAVLHSALGSAERLQEWERVRRGEARVVVGPRSAVFAPVSDLGLVVVDEEQDLAYKQETVPRYHGRDLALVRCRQVAGVALLVSATPSLEVRRGVVERRIASLVLTERVGSGRLPEGILVDLRQEPRDPRVGEVVFSARLREELAAALRSGDQVILLRNRRGYAPLLLCRACGEDFRCPACGLPRTYHRRGARLLCHYCGSTLAAPQRCPSCRGETLEAIGAGTERVEERVQELFPEASIDVLDRDASRRGGGPAAILERFQSGSTQILVGTQMISKGHHFPRVALTAVLSADGYLGFPDFRAVEKTYALLTQLAGRAGRGERPGRVVVQSYLPDHYAIRAALAQDDAGFAEQEMRFRRIFHYPPYTRMIQLLSRDRNRERALAKLEEVVRRVLATPGAERIRLTGPAPAPLERLRGEWRMQCLARSDDGRLLRRAVGAALGSKAVPGLAVDVDPYQLL